MPPTPDASQTPATLICFLGNNPYDETSYTFPNGTQKASKYFSLALKEHLREHGGIERFVLLGTETSAWGMFSEDHFLNETQIKSIEKISAELGSGSGKVTQATLDNFATQLTPLLGIEIRCLLIPYATKVWEQAKILTNMAEAARESKRVVLDITHGFRHLPMLALVAARYLKHAQGIEVTEVYYGKYVKGDTNGEAVNLIGMLQMLDWVEALAVYDHSGDYGIFAPLFKDDGMEPGHAAMLERGAYFERVGNIKKAKNCLDRVLPVIESIDAHKQHGKYLLGNLFSDALIKRLEWRGLSRQQQEVALYERYLERGDYLRAAIFLQESVVTRLVEQRGQKGFRHQKEERRVREAASKALIQSESIGGIHAFWELSNLRNAMAHGRRDGIMLDDTSDAFETPENLKKKLMTLRETIDKALKKRTPRWEHVQDDKGFLQPVLYLDN